MAHSKRSEEVNPIFLKTGIALVVVLILVVIAFRLIQVPYTVVETYQVVEEYTVNETYLENETQQVAVAVTTTENYIKNTTMPARQPVEGLKPSPTAFSGGRACKFADYEYTFEYIKSLPLEYNKYDPISEIGYHGKDNTLRQGVKICNLEKRRMQVNFRICKWTGDQLANCIDRLDTRIMAKSCELKILNWLTNFDDTKHMTVEPIEVSKKLVCKDGAGEYTTSSLNPTLLDDEALKDVTQETPHLLTESGRYHPFAQYPRESLYDVLTKEDVTVTIHEPTTRTVRTFEQQEEDVEVEKTRAIPQTRVVERQRVITKYQSLFDALMAKLVSS